ncbi:MAG: hypothetical protein GX897_00420 [Clostridiales bacterium]|nr:hypothetical protein [Clostridiales bacterium]
MKYKKKLLLLVIIHLLTVLCSCGNSEAQITQETEISEPQSYIDLASAVIIRSDYASDAIVKTAVELLGAFNEQFGGNVKITNDDDMMYGADAEGAVRVLVGDTKLSPDGSDATYYSSAMEALGDSDHIIMIFEDNTIVLAGKTESATKRAAKAFAGEYLSGGEKLMSNTPFSRTGEKPQPASDDFSDFVPTLRFIAATDIHIKDQDTVEKERLLDMFRYSYAYADSQEYKSIDAVVFSGDVTDHGTAKQLTRFRNAVESSIREETQFICSMGNHEFFNGSQSIFERVIQQDADQHNIINGFHFITISPEGAGANDYSSKYDWVREELDKAIADNPEAPIFVFQHHHIRDTVYVSEEWYTDQLDEIFKDYPNIVNFSGHSHGAINNPRSIYQDKYTLLGAGTLSYFEMNSGMSYGTVPPRAGLAAQFFIIEADENNRVRILPFNILTGNFFTRQTEGKPEEQLIWYLTAPSDPDTFVYTRERWTDSAPPYFDDNAVITAKVTANGSRVSITFPQARDDDCVYSYKLELKGKGYSFSYSVFSEYYFEPMPETISISATGIKEGNTYTATITAYDCYGIPCENPLVYEFTA